MSTHAITKLTLGQALELRSTQVSMFEQTRKAEDSICLLLGKSSKLLVPERELVVSEFNRIMQVKQDLIDSIGQIDMHIMCLI